ncbi:hypothetical protein VTI28DRAFT_2760 [Corynascus sepedonium]
MIRRYVLYIENPGVRGGPAKPRKGAPVSTSRAPTLCSFQQRHRPLLAPLPSSLRPASPVDRSRRALLLRTPHPGTSLSVGLPAGSRENGRNVERNAQNKKAPMPSRVGTLQSPPVTWLLLVSICGFGVLAFCARALERTGTGTGHGARSTVRRVFLFVC